MTSRLPLTTEQHRAAVASASHVFIVAAPGAGKTKVATERYGIERWSVGKGPGRTLGVSFARSATRELRTRVQARWGSASTIWPNGVQTLDSLLCDILQYLLKKDLLCWPGGHVQLNVLTTWQGQVGARYLRPEQRWRRVATIKGREVTSTGARITRPDIGFGTKAPFEQHLSRGLCTHEEVRQVLVGALGREDLRGAIAQYFYNTTSHLIVDEVFDANQLDLDLILLASEAGVRTTLIGDPWQALYEFRGAQPHLVPDLVEKRGYERFHITQSFRFATEDMQSMTKRLRDGQGVVVSGGRVSDVDVVLAPGWDALWGGGREVLPLSHGRVANLTDAAMTILLDHVTRARFGVRAMFVDEALSLLGIESRVVRTEGAAALRAVLLTMGEEGPGAGRALGELREAMRRLGCSRQLRALPAAKEAEQKDRLVALGVRLAIFSCVPGMTIHQAKGKEWGSVGLRLDAAEQGRVTQGLKQEDAVDRTLYVGLTRARESVTLI